MNTNLFTNILLVILLSLVTSKMVYFGYTANYATDTMSRKTFHGRFDHDVYKYRILSQYMLFKVDDWLSESMPEKGAEPRILVQTPDGSERFFLAFYYLNTFFLVLTSILVVLLLNMNRSFELTEMEKNLIVFLVPIVINLSQYVICCYDISSYFFQLLILYVFLKMIDRNYWITLGLVGSLIILSTLNRESSALSVSMVGLLLLTKFGINKRSILSIGAIAGCFLATYLGLRYFIVDPSHIRIINLQAGQILIDTNIIGLFFWGLFFYLPFSTVNTPENRWLIVAFFLFSLPYIWTVFKDGVLWEVRLYIPLFLGSLFLSKIDTSSNVFKLTTLFADMGRLLKKSSPASSRNII